MQSNVVENGSYPSEPGLSVEQVPVQTRARVEFLDLTDTVAQAVRRSGVGWGLAHVQSRHTTTGIVVNENEPLLLEDFRRLLEEWAPARACYRHNDLDARTAVPRGERPNADAHARALLLGSSECLGVLDGRLQLGRWQRLFLVELDGPRLRTVSLTVLGWARTSQGVARPAAPRPTRVPR